MVRLGFHVSISGSIDRAVERALELGCDAFQIFTRNPRSWASRALGEAEVAAFREKRRLSGIGPVFGHMPYILNLASPEDEVYFRSVESLSVGLGRCSALGIRMLVTHIGSHLGSGLEKGIRRVVGALNGVLDEDETGVVILLENGTGSRNSVGSRFEELRSIIDGVRRPGQVGVCLDTCHAFSAGFDLRTPEGLGGMLGSMDESLGPGRLRLVHLNDSVGGLGSGIDHHEHIGLGGIGLEGFRLIMRSRLVDLPMIMETPIDDRRDNAENMRIALELAST
ncbi:MAG: deoxyribonuclease IV [Candidatus Bathyarchaeota archaeon]|nr:deoxyribonuclease IV [Candidatus Bathyarchaeota archaeon]